MTTQDAGFNPLTTCIQVGGRATDAGNGHVHVLGQANCPAMDAQTKAITYVGTFKLDLEGPNGEHIHVADFAPAQLKDGQIAAWGFDTTLMPKGQWNARMTVLRPDTGFTTDCLIPFTVS